MPIPSENQAPGAPPISRWAPQPKAPPRSVFGNYVAEVEREKQGAAAESGPESSRRRFAGVEQRPLQSAIDAALARSFVYRALAQCFEYPTPQGWNALCHPQLQRSLVSCTAILAAPESPLVRAARTFSAELRQDNFEIVLSSYLRVFGHAARGQCPLNEIEYGDLKADPLFQPHRLADLAGFYHAFGLELAQDADERQDHLCLELEFMCVLTAKEAYALEHQLDEQELAVCRSAQRKFLKEHLGRWTPAFARRLGQIAAGTPLALLADLTQQWIAAECGRFGIDSGSEDLLLRPVDEAAESLCASCNLSASALGAPASLPAPGGKCDGLAVMAGKDAGAPSATPPGK